MNTEPLQRTENWHKQRKGKITGSVVGAILGLNKNKTAKEVMREMVRAYYGAEREFVGNSATSWGTNNESYALDMYLMQNKHVEFKEVGFIVHPEHEWLGASPDGILKINGRLFLIEIKCPYGLRDKLYPEFKTLAQQPHYYAQIQIQMYCTGIHECVFYQWTPYGEKEETATFNKEWIEQNIVKLEKFYQAYLLEIDNPEHLQPKNRAIDMTEADFLIQEYDRLSEQLKTLDERKKQIMDRLVEIAEGQNADFNGRKLTLVNKAGAVSYSKVVKELLPDADLTKYTGAPSTYWKLS